MKTAKPLAAAAAPADLTSSRRAQPVRQTRINPPRHSTSFSRPFSGPAPGQPVEIFPAITHFADAITALPKELVRHFTLLKEVDAKIFAPEEALGHLVDAALSIPPPQRRPAVPGASAAASVNGSIVNSQDENYDLVDPVHDPENYPRRHLLRQCAFSIQEMLMSLDEKNHVIATTTEALNKQLARLDECYPHIEHEVSDEARYGSDTHWAYLENRMAKTAPPDPRSRRDGVAVVSQAAQLIADEHAARSDARKQAMLAKKARNQHADSDFDDHDKHKGESAKKGHGSKAKRAEPAAAVGLGITNGTVNGANPPKRRKVEKPTPTSTPVERPAILPNTVATTKGKVASPRETPVPEPRKRPRGGAATNGQTRKRNNTVTSVVMSPSLASSPVHSTFAEAKSVSRGSPGPPNGRPRARQNSIHSMVESKVPRPASSASNKQTGSTAILPDMAPLMARAASEAKAKELAAQAEPDPPAAESPREEPEPKPVPVSSSRKGSLKREDTEANPDAMQGVQSTNLPTVTTKSGRASKPSTPALSQFPEPIRPRSSRESSSKRSKKASSAQLAALQLLGGDTTPAEEEDVEPDPDEPTYCYCNGVSYGEMVACDNAGCAKEWFHLDCVGLKTAPKGNAKWYCEDCKEIMRAKRFGR